MQTTYYDLLGVDSDATPEAIKKAYQRQARQTHPDTGNPHGAHLFTLVTDAYNTLKNPESRAAYDASLRGSASSTSSASPSGTTGRRDYWNDPFYRADAPQPTGPAPVAEPEPAPVEPVVDKSAGARARRAMKTLFGTFTRGLLTYATAFALFVTVWAFFDGFWAGIVNFFVFILIAAMLGAYVFGSGIITRLLFYGALVFCLYTFYAIAVNFSSTGIMGSISSLLMSTAYLSAAIACLRIRFTAEI